jgi:2-ketocyclohexanecarboxyl-CoA hydrolase
MDLQHTLFEARDGVAWITINHPAYIELSKITSNVWWDMLAPAMEHAMQTLIRLAGGEEMTEGASAFIEKRKPDFSRFRRQI